MIKVIVFDFDGTLVDSNDIKWDAWFDIFPEHEKVSPKLISTALEEIVGNRYVLLDEIYKRLGREGSSETFVKRYAEKFDEIVQNEIVSIGGLNPDVREMLNGFRDNCKIYINSSTPNDAMQKTAARLDMLNLFHGIYGTFGDRNKEQNLRRIIIDEGMAPENVLVVGDGEDDVEAAKAVGCRFIGLASDWNGWKDKEFSLVSNLSEIKNLIVQL